MILQCAVLFAFLALGELIVWLTGVRSTETKGGKAYVGRPCVGFSCEKSRILLCSRRGGADALSRADKGRMATDCSVGRGEHFCNFGCYRPCTSNSTLSYIVA